MKITELTKPVRNTNPNTTTTEPTEPVRCVTMLGADPTQCQHNAHYWVEGLPMCSRHAGDAARDYLMHSAHVAQPDDNDPHPPNVERLYPSADPDVVLREAVGEYEDVLILGWPKDSDCIDSRANRRMTGRMCLWLTESFKHKLLNGDFAE